MTGSRGNNDANRPSEGSATDSAIDSDAEHGLPAGKRTRERKPAKPSASRLAENSAGLPSRPSAPPAEQRLIIVGPRHLRDGIRDLLSSLPDFGSSEIVYLDATGEGQATTEGASSLASSLGTLSARQLEVAWLARQGLSNREIGALLHIDSTTVKSHLGDAFKKLGLRRRSQLGSILA